MLMNNPAARKIQTQFKSICPLCNQTITPGTDIWWVRGEKGEHVTCPVVTVSVVPETPKVLVNPVDASKIIDLLCRAAQFLKSPKMRFLGPDGNSELRLSRAKDTSKNAGCIYVTLRDNYMGMIHPDGSVKRLKADLIAYIERIAVDPVKAAREYGAWSGRCSFCGLELTDAGSVEAGYGPICAKNYGLPHVAKGTPKLTETVPEYVAPEEPVMVSGFRVVRM